MDKERKRYRDFSTIFKDGLWPNQGLCPDPEESLRHQAVLEVLSCIPKRDYSKLKTAVGTFQWFIPHERTMGFLCPFPADRKGDAIVLYLSPRLELVAWSRTLATTAHELAHLVLGHPLRGGKDEGANEEEAWGLVCEWGFEQEVKRHRAVHKWWGSWDKYMVRKVKAEMRGDLSRRGEAQE